MNIYNIAVLPGDGIGKEIMPHAINVLNTAAQVTGRFMLEQALFPWGCEHYLETGVIMPKDGIEQLRQFDALYFVAAGHPKVTDYLSAWEFIFVMRKHFKQYINLRPIRNFPGVPTLLAKQDWEIDMMIVRENSEGEYAGPGGMVHAGFDNELAIQEMVFTRTGVSRCAHYAFNLARTRRKRVTNITKSNALLHGLVFWDKVIEEVAAHYPDVEYEKLYIDAATMKFLQKPAHFDVVLGTNLYGDILSDLGGAMVGSIGLAPSCNLNPERDFPSMFEPVHGSAPDIAGKGIANPTATILAGAMMLDHLGEREAGQLIRKAVDAVMREGQVRTGDLGGRASTGEMAAAIAAKMRLI
ncbi:MAG: isocitrate/isopropylmalate dehydrogenase family protein [Anaerolineae bacterium]|nr:isocitrate/isopropylmalate dehydrogenase family protein [Anaerolineae bacterium]